MNPLKYFQRSRNSEVHPNAHMTWAGTSVGRGVTMTGGFLKKQLWIWPIIAVIALSIVGYLVQRAIETTMKKNISSGLETLLNAETAMMKSWFKTQESNVESLANSIRTRELFYKLMAHEPDPPTDGADDIHSQLNQILAPVLTSHDYVGYFVADKSKQILASNHAALVGQRQVDEYDDFLNKVFDGETVISPPFPGVVMMKSESGKVRMGEPTMFVAAPMRDNNFQVIGALALQIRPEREFTRTLQIGRLGKSGETYAFDKEGVMVSNSRFDEDLILLGLIPDRADSRSILNILVRDPGGDLTEGFRSKIRRAQLPLTKMAASAIGGNSNVDVQGYRDYRGVPVVGAWTWLPKYEIGVATEIDVAEAFRPLTILHRAFWSLYGLLILSSVAIFVFTIVVSRLRRDAQKAVIEAKQLGQYTLEERIGVGAMGVVFKGHHSMLRRPTAIKMLDVDKVNEASLARFEREVQITCHLNHPNTIAIYDYGRTPEELFYYAMEFLDGINLQTLIEDYGPQPENRVIHILLQVCGSLFEAHSQGLVHRDIKPANIMLNRRGCLPDMVKVLDFGLVKAIDDEKNPDGDSSNSLTGTPLYMSPEAIQTPLSVDARSDIYAVGAVGYFLLTGKPVFEANSLSELCRKHVDELPSPPSERIGTKVSRELENAILASLDKSRAKRPQTARDLAKLLENCEAAGTWTVDDGDAWWGRHERGQGATTTDAKAVDKPTTPTNPNISDQTLDQVAIRPANKTNGADSSHSAKPRP